MRGAQLVEAEEGGSGKYGLIDEEYFLSESTSDAMGSSLSHFFRVSASIMSAKFAKNLSQLLGGLKRTVSKDRQKNVKKLDKWKVSMLSEV